MLPGKMRAKKERLGRRWLLPARVQEWSVGVGGVVFLKGEQHATLNLSRERMIKNAILNAAQVEGEGPQSGRAQVFSQRTFAWVPPGFIGPGVQLSRGFRATESNLKTRFKEKNNQNRDTFNVFLVGKTGGGEDFEWAAGVVVDTS
jgi:hypothetical protein